MGELVRTQQCPTGVYWGLTGAGGSGSAAGAGPTGRAGGRAGPAVPAVPEPTATAAPTVTTLPTVTTAPVGSPRPRPPPHCSLPGLLLRPAPSLCPPPPPPPPCPLCPGQSLWVSGRGDPAGCPPSPPSPGLTWPAAAVAWMSSWLRGHHGRLGRQRRVRWGLRSVLGMSPALVSPHTWPRRPASGPAAAAAALSPNAVPGGRRGWSPSALDPHKESGHQGLCGHSLGTHRGRSCRTCTTLS